jgi:hypothetical protein
MARSPEPNDGSYSASPDKRGAIRLIECLACLRQISEEAEACPHCGHPNKPAVRQLEGPSCYACAATATTRCQSCGAMSCATHLQSVFVAHGKGGGYELRCESCYSSAMAWASFRWGIAIVGLIIAAIFFFGFFLPKWNEAGRFMEENQRWRDELWRDDKQK